jgi:predicted MFS family arabinose efflux permease
MIGRGTIALLLVSVAIHSACVYAAGVYFPLFAQTVAGASASLSGILFLPFPGGLIVTTFFSGRIVARLGIRGQLVVGSTLAALGYLALAMRATPEVRPEALVGLGLIGAGLGMAAPLFMVSVQGAVARDELATATTSVQLFRRLGSSTGVAALGALLLIGLAGAPVPAAGQALTPAARVALAQALRLVFATSGALALASALLLAFTRPTDRGA